MRDGATTEELEKEREGRGILGVDIPPHPRLVVDGVGFGFGFLILRSELEVIASSGPLRLLDGGGSHPIDGPAC
ncbi:hypothetical protein GH714_027325 [Hevea brasiliensis]|uniref:Uncharacterized protein n=1 Tax=Hevea brasiliensis TaxID=3981 RepID=A0A6A6LRN4_HEVBR|nr:hypothetical protein GH714_027325 [Hevea brasiliensis]